MPRFLLGAIFMAFAVAGLFSCVFGGTRAIVFLLFSLAFFILTINRIGFFVTSEQNVKGDSLYGVRLVAFVLILIAIMDKNRSHKTPDG